MTVNEDIVEERERENIKHLNIAYVLFWRPRHGEGWLSATHSLLVLYSFVPHLSSLSFLSLSLSLSFWYFNFILLQKCRLNFVLFSFFLYIFCFLLLLLIFFFSFLIFRSHLKLLSLFSPSLFLLFTNDLFAVCE